MSNNLNFFYDNSKYEDHSRHETINIRSENAEKIVRDIMRNIFSDSEEVPFEDVEDTEDNESDDTTAQIESGSINENPKVVKPKSKRGRPKAKPFRDYIDANQYDVEALIGWLRESFAKAADTPEGQLIYLMAVRHCFNQQPAFSSFQKEFGYRFSSPTYITKDEWSGADNHRFPKSEVEKLKPIINIKANFN